MVRSSDWEGAQEGLLVLVMFGFLIWVLVTRVCSDVAILYTYNACTSQYVCYTSINDNNNLKQHRPELAWLMGGDAWGW